MGDPKTHKPAQKADKGAQKTHAAVQKTLHRDNVDDQVETLHRLLNYHYSQDLPLPIGHAAGARNFGPLPEDRVKKFHRAKKINFGTKRNMSGVRNEPTRPAPTKTPAAGPTIAVSGRIGRH